MEQLPNKKNGGGKRGKTHKKNKIGGKNSGTELGRFLNIRNVLIYCPLKNIKKMVKAWEELT